MALTEVVYKIRNAGHPLCELTQEHADVDVILTPTSWDAEALGLTAILTISGPDEPARAALARVQELFEWTKVLEEGKGHLVVKAKADLDRLARLGSPLAFTLEYFGETGIVQPILVRQGYYNTRVLVPGKVDLASMLTAYEKGVKAGRWNDFKLVRIDEADPHQQIAGAFTEGLTQKQLEVIKTALALGFYDTPRKVTLDDLSSIFGISKAAVHNRLQAAERKVISKFFS